MNFTSEKVLGGFALGTFLFVCFQYNQIIELKKEVKIKDFQVSYMMQKYDSFYRRVDTLEADLFPCEVEMSRFQHGLEIFYKKNPIAAKEFDDIRSYETE